jgi:hypothetical protein
MLRRILKTATFVHDVLHSVLLTVFLGLLAMLLAAWLGGNLWVAVGAGALGLAAGVAVSRRVWFEKTAPVEEPTPPEWRLPLIQDEYERIRARQRALGFLLIAAFLMLAALRLAADRNWPGLFGVPVDRLLAGTLVVVAIVIPLGLWNWRCPNCRRNLGRSLSIRQCPHCGIVLRG